MSASDFDRETARVGTAAPGCPAEQSSAASPPNIQRRVFLATSIATIAGLALWQWRKTAVLQAAPLADSAPKEVTIILFSDAGERLQQVRIAKVIKTTDQWRQQLPPGVFDITRHADTEIAFSGKYWNLHDKGIDRCICCDNALFDSATKFESGTGWPSVHRRRERARDPRHNSRYSAHGGRLHRMRRPPRPRLRRRPRTHPSPLLHEFRLSALRKTDLRLARSASAKRMREPS